MKRLYEYGDSSKLRADQAKRIEDVLAHLDVASKPSDVDIPGYRLHRLKGDLEDVRSISISGNWRITFRFEDGDAVDVDLVDYHWNGEGIMSMKNPPHPGRSIKDACLDPLGLDVTSAAKVLGIARHTLSRIIHGHAGISPDMAIRLEKAGWSTADHWLRLQTAHDLAQARRHQDQIKVERYQPHHA